jgi:hypothetical protein
VPRPPDQPLRALSVGRPQENLSFPKNDRRTGDCFAAMVVMRYTQRLWG